MYKACKAKLLKVQHSSNQNTASELVQMYSSDGSVIGLGCVVRFHLKVLDLLLGYLDSSCHSHSEEDNLRSHFVKSCLIENPD